ncbi:hypothetical protein [Levilactobacillus zymae]|uniref:Uncharacterized protein n=1 Tax=Levilactobacillus zymae TaxID=267363 RepID=A0A1Y6K0C7_9LACO|nr:hypothetical protein [Levilactobacillus zymae]GEO71755.1 hypothetical protein LZY01_09230 [Levilactobacillus zymae]SMS14543.1 hypothetical protein LZ3411_1493 [Levilactobacillus zymae]
MSKPTTIPTRDLPFNSTQRAQAKQLTTFFGPNRPTPKPATK